MLLNASALMGAHGDNHSWTKFLRTCASCSACAEGRKAARSTYPVRLRGDVERAVYHSIRTADTASDRIRDWTCNPCVCVYMLRISMFLYTLHRFLLTVFWASSAHSSHGQAGGRLKQLSLQCFVCICFSAFRIEACDEFHAR